MGGIVLQQIALAVATVLHQLLWLYFYVVLIRVLLSWVNPDPRNALVRFVYGVTEPVLVHLRRLPFLLIGSLDLSPLALGILVQVLDIVVVGSLRAYYSGPYGIG